MASPWRGIGSGSHCAHRSCRTRVSGLILGTRMNQGRCTFALFLPLCTALPWTEYNIPGELKSPRIVTEKLDEIVNQAIALQVFVSWTPLQKNTRVVKMIVSLHKRKPKIKIIAHTEGITGEKPKAVFTNWGMAGECTNQRGSEKCWKTCFQDPRTTIQMSGEQWALSLWNKVKKVISHILTCSRHCCPVIQHYRSDRGFSKG